MDNIMNILNWFIANPVVITMIIVIVIALIVFVWSQEDVLLKSALYIVAKVEDEWGSDMGRVKFAEAYEYMRHKYPVVTFFMSKEKLTSIIEDALIQLKNILASKASKEKTKSEDATKA